MSLVNDMLNDLGQGNKRRARSAKFGMHASNYSSQAVVEVPFSRHFWYIWYTVVVIILLLAVFSFSDKKLIAHLQALSQAYVEPEFAVEPELTARNMDMPLESETRSDKRQIVDMAQADHSLPQNDNPDSINAHVSVTPEQLNLDIKSTSTIQATQPAHFIKEISSEHVLWPTGLITSDEDSVAFEKSEPVSIEKPDVALTVNRVEKTQVTRAIAANSLQARSDKIQGDAGSAAVTGVTLLPLSAEQQLLQEYRVAANIYKEGNYTKAEQLLEGLLARDQSHHKARLLLARLYAKQNQGSRAELLLSNGLLHYPQYAPYVSLYARMLAGQGRDTAAVDALENALPGARDDAEYHALLAGLYQRTGNSSAASRTYQLALQLDPMHGEWWMGLGISSEQLGDESAAENAYKEALQFPLAMEVEKYANQRLQQFAKNKAAYVLQQDN